MSEQQKMTYEVVDEVVTTSDNKYTKEKNTNGQVIYRGPNGSFVSQKSWAAANGNEAIIEIQNGEPVTKKRKYANKDKYDLVVQTPDKGVVLTRRQAQWLGRRVANPDEFQGKIPKSKQLLGGEYTWDEMREAFDEADTRKPDVGAVRYIT